ncbi:class I SAM-dependent methyltransferase [Pyxidicoccus sp. MSG2]|uniref:class I SAM-dependent methyltransferase n=1 Tax=Pyxidicoccus sp. MSG2 TaxID=2996790 RepID=UPI002271660B|nr:class I SAM-dependent methyltransferase [Pyxidicoccus sp. MSG2]MCY1022010.1 methyltransferase domain-containing protein [Pyxidicoccus sp. MSG2]
MDRAVRPAVRLASRALSVAASRSPQAVTNTVSVDSARVAPFPSDWPRVPWARCCIDHINAVAVNVPSLRAQVSAHPDGLLGLQGWAFDPDAEVQDGELKILVDGVPYRAYLGDERQDLVRVFNAPSAGYCGFRADVPVSDLRAGEHHLAFEWVTPGRQQVLRCEGRFELTLDPKGATRDEEHYNLWGRTIVVKRSALAGGSSGADRLSQQSLRHTFRELNSLFLLMSKSPYLHSSPRHVADDEAYALIYKAFLASNVRVEEYSCDPAGFDAYLAHARPLYDARNYVAHYGGERGYYLEKAFEHYLSWEYLRWKETDRVMDLACWISPAAQVLSSWRRADFYAHDITLKTDLEKRTVSGYANAIEAPNDYFDAVMAHCSIDNFEGRADIDVFHEMARILKPGGRALFVPLHMAARAENLIALGSPDIELDEGAHLVMGPPGGMRFARHYSVQSLQDRILRNVPELDFHVVHVRNPPREAYPPTTTARFMLVATKRAR